MENKCQLIRGFFVLRPCGRDAKLTCKICGKSICRRCASSGDPKACKECHTDNEKYSEGWTYSRRRARYGSTIGSSHSSNRTFDDNDEAAFEPGNQSGSESADWGDDADVSAFDS